MADEITVDPIGVKNRWRTIRGNKDCDLSLTADSVAKYLSKPESELVQDRIRESLVQLARFRVKKKFQSTKPAGTGELATCEGLEAFLVPAVEQVLPISVVLAAIEAKQAFADCFLADVNELLEQWLAERFSGEPYAVEATILASLLPKHAVKIKRLDIVEAAAMACRVLTHLLTLKLTAGPEEADFRRLIGDKLIDKELFEALKKAIGFLVRSFRKGEGKSDEERIASAKSDDEPGSGWSWTDWPGLPPMLFFTAAAVDAFAELDLYVIRVAESAEANQVNTEQQDLVDFYTQNKQLFDLLQLCVDMARRWVKSDAILPNLSMGDGYHPESEITVVLEKDKSNRFAEELRRDEVKETPTLLYNSLYGLQVLLWCWADRDEDGTGEDEVTKNAINRALAQLVYNYDAVPIVRKVLSEIDYVVVLPGKDYFKADTDQNRHYVDAAFLPLLTRLLVLFVVYGVGDRNLLEPVIRKLYVELLQNRHRNDTAFSALWSSDAIQIFSTQRAVQALTFYSAYAAGKERAEHRNTGDGETTGRGIVLRNSTGLPLILEAIVAGPVTARAPEPPPASPEFYPKLPDAKGARNFANYCRLIDSGFKGGDKNIDPKLSELLNGLQDKGEEILEAVKAEKVRDPVIADFILYALMRLLQTPVKSDGVGRFEEIKLITAMARHVVIQDDEEAMPS